MLFLFRITCNCHFHTVEFITNKSGLEVPDLRAALARPCASRASPWVSEGNPFGIACAILIHALWNSNRFGVSIGYIDLYRHVCVS